MGFLLEDARKKFDSAISSCILGTLPDDDETKLYHEVAAMIPDCVDVDTLILAFKIAFEDARRCNKNTVPFIALVPRYVTQIATLEFAYEFRKKYIVEILGLDYWELPNVDYGCVEIEPDVIDISNKDPYEVLAALYNASIPIGAGFISYQPMSWTAETARVAYEKVDNPPAGTPSINYVPIGERLADGTVYFKYVLGRTVFCKFSEDLSSVDVRRYNGENFPGLAQKVIATCPNKNETLTVTSSEPNTR